MKFTELIVLLPCHSLEDFPLYHTGQAADGLLAAWTALWHPALIVSARAAPTWQRVDAPPEELEGRLLVLPAAGHDRLPESFAERAASHNALLITDCASRGEIVEAALAALDDPPKVDQELAADFFALGFCRLQVELLTRQMRYSISLDEQHFSEELLAAAQAAVTGDAAEARSHLTQCFNLLYEARKYFYPVDAYLIDLTLAASTTIGQALRCELKSPMPINVLISGEVLEQMAQQEPATLSELRQAVESDSVSVAGGEYQERELPLLPVESILEQFTKGLAAHQRLLGRRPKVFGRRRFGLSPLLPQILTRLGFVGAVHVTLDDGCFPLAQQSKTRWEAPDGSVIDALTRVPADAALPESLLEFSRKMSDAMDVDHVATVVFAHWPGKTSCWYEDLRRVARYTPALGKFVTLDEYFAQTDTPGRLSKFNADEYRSPYLVQAVERGTSDPISSIVQEHRRRITCESVAAVDTLSALLGAAAAPAASSCGAPSSESANSDGCAADPVVKSAVERFSTWLPRRSDAQNLGYLALNPCSFSRQIGIHRNLAELPTDSGRQSAEDRQMLRTVAEVPGMGFAWVDSCQPPMIAKAARAVAEGHVLRNEHFSAVIHSQSGGIQSIHDSRTRGNRLSQRLALCNRSYPAQVTGSGSDVELYSVMQADTIEVTSAGPVLAEIASRGGLVDQQGARIAQFRQTTQLWSGSRVLMLRIELDPIQEPGHDPWNSYYAARFAWSDATADLWRSVGLGRQPTEARRLEAPSFIEIQSDKTRTTIFTGGLPYHRRREQRMLDSLLIVRGESARSFTMAIGIDVPHSAPAALDLMAPEMVMPQLTPPPAADTSGWLFRLDVRNVVATNWQLIAVDGAPRASIEDQSVGFRVRLLETAGLAGRVKLHAFRSIASANQVDFDGKVMLDAPAEDATILVDIAAYEWIEIEAFWK